MNSDIEARLRRLEDRALISEVVVRYAMGVDRRDWEMFGSCFTERIQTDYSGLGSPPREWMREEFVGMVRDALSGFTATQHLSTNHVVAFDEDDADRATCHSYMYAQHLLEGSEAGDFYLARGSYANHMLRTRDGWRIERIVQYVTWQECNTNAVAESAAKWST